MKIKSRVQLLENSITQIRNLSEQNNLFSYFCFEKDRNRNFRERARTKLSSTDN